MSPKEDFFRLVRSIFQRKNLNKYTVTLGLFFFWICFMDGNNLYQQYKLKRTLNELKQGKIDLEYKLAEAIKARNDLENNIEKYAREKYFMHKADEEIIIIERN